MKAKQTRKNVARRTAAKDVAAELDELRRSTDLLWEGVPAVLEIATRQREWIEYLAAQVATLTDQVRSLSTRPPPRPRRWR